MAIYYFKTEEKQTKGYIKKCIIDALKSEGFPVKEKFLRVFNTKKHPYADLGFTKVVINYPMKRVNVKINYRLHRNGRMHRIFKEDENKRGLYLIKDVRAIIGEEVASGKIDEIPTTWTELNVNQVKRPDMGTYPDGRWYLDENNSCVINIDKHLQQDAKVYVNLCKARKTPKVNEAI